MKLKPWLRNLGRALACGNEFFECEGKRWPIKKLGPVKGVKIGNWLYIQQNPNKPSHWAKLVKEGSRVIQIKRNDEYWGVIVNSTLLRYENKKTIQEGKL